MHRGAQNLVAGHCQPNTPAGALEQDYPEANLQLGNAPAERRLFDPEGVSRLPKAPVARSGDGIAQMFEFELRCQDPGLLKGFPAPPPIESRPSLTSMWLEVAT